MTEAWGVYPPSPRYQVSTLGRVRGPSGKLLKGFFARQGGYRTINVVGLPRYSVKFTQVKVARMVLETFVGSPPVDYIACHRNDIPTDDRLVNLYWGTRRNNWDDAVRNQRIILKERS